MRALLLLLVVLLLVPFAGAEEFEETDESTPLFKKALELQRKKKWVAARNAFRKMLKMYPLSVHAEEADYRSDDNAYLGTDMIWKGGPFQRRIDVSVMGDGFTIDSRDQALEEKWAKLCVDVLFNEKSFLEYRQYFNIYFVRLASLEEGVDPTLSEAERKKIEERNRRRVRKRKTDYNTALDCKAAGPQGQVVADRGLVMQWLQIAEEDFEGCGNDQQVIAFARFGRLGMGGGGIANVGRPDKAVTVHEFGHSFVGLADEYQGNPNPPRGIIRAPNASTTDDPKEVPWAHFLAKRVPGVGIYEGGATYNKGVWRPARACAMNAGGSDQYCPVCRETAVLAIYSYVSPIDERSPDPKDVVKVVEGDKDTVLTVVPMRPAKHPLSVSWFVKRLEPGEKVPRPKKERGNYGWGRSHILGYSAGERAREDRSHLDDPPLGEESKLGKVEGRGRQKNHVFPVGKLDPGRYAVTVVVTDTTPWVLKDPQHLLTEREIWTVEVSE